MAKIGTAGLFVSATALALGTVPLFTAQAASVTSQTPSLPAYPATARGPVVDEAFGEQVPDP